MLSNIQDDHYNILSEYAKVPTQVNCKELNGVLLDTRNALKNLSGAFQKLIDLDVFDVVDEEVLFGKLDEVDVRLMAEGVNDLLDKLITSEDEMPEPPKTTLSDLGFEPSDMPGDDEFYTRVITDTDEKEVVEEIVFTKGEILHRVRTIFWEKTDYGRSSKLINYEQLELSDTLKRVIENTFEEKMKGRENVPE